MKRTAFIIVIAIAAAAFILNPLSARTPAEKTTTAPLQAVIDPDRQSYADIKNLIDKGSDVNYKDASGATPLMKAAYLGDLALVKLLIDKGADANAADNEGITVLMNAASSSNLELVKLIAARGADVNVRDRGGASALMYAALSPRDETATSEFLVNSGADPGARDSQGYSAYSIALNRGKSELAGYLKSLPAGEDPLMKYLLYSVGGLILLLFIKVAINKYIGSAAPKSSQKKAPATRAGAGTGDVATKLVAAEKNSDDLFDALAHGDLEKLKKVIADGGVDLLDSSGKSLLMAAAGRGLDDIAVFLIEKKADVNFQDASGRTALMCAAHSGGISTVRLLIGAGADVNFRDNNGLTAYSIASDKGNQKIINFLKTAGADDARADNAGMEAKNAGNDAKARTFAAVSPEPVVREIVSDSGFGAELRAAVSEGDLDKTLKLISKNADVNAADKNGTTAIMLAANGGRLDLIKTLVEAKADVNVSNAKGLTPLIIAAGKGHVKAAVLLIKSGADCNAKTKSGVTALKFAVEKGFGDVAAVLKKAGAKE